MMKPRVNRHKGQLYTLNPEFYDPHPASSTHSRISSKAPVSFLIGLPSLHAVLCCCRDIESQGRRGRLDHGSSHIHTRVHSSRTDTHTALPCSCYYPAYLTLDQRKAPTATSIAPAHYT